MPQEHPYTIPEARTALTQLDDPYHREIFEWALNELARRTGIVAGNMVRDAGMVMISVADRESYRQAVRDVALFKAALPALDDAISFDDEFARPALESIKAALANESPKAHKQPRTHRPDVGQLATKVCARRLDLEHHRRLVPDVADGEPMAHAGQLDQPRLLGWRCWRPKGRSFVEGAHGALLAGDSRTLRIRAGQSHHPLKCRVVQNGSIEAEPLNSCRDDAGVCRDIKHGARHDGCVAVDVVVVGRHAHEYRPPHHRCTAPREKS